MQNYKEKYGFIYIWYDKKRKMFYVGSHWGNENDEYVCSSVRMRNTHKRRPQDFKRRILTLVFDRKIIFDEERRWLKLIKQHEIGKRYYNLHNGNCYPHWSLDENKRLTVGQKISKANKGRKSWCKGIPRTQECKDKISKTLPGCAKTHIYTDEDRQKLKERAVQQHKTGNWGNYQPHSEETKQKMRDNNAMKNPKYIQKVKNSKQGIEHLKHVDGRHKMAVPGSDYWNQLVSEGFRVPIWQGNKHKVFDYNV